MGLEEWLKRESRGNDALTWMQPVRIETFENEIAKLLNADRPRLRVCCWFGSGSVSSAGLTDNVDVVGSRRREGDGFCCDESPSSHSPSI